MLQANEVKKDIRLLQHVPFLFNLRDSLHGR